MRITNVHRDAYVLHAMGYTPFDIAKQLQQDFGGLFTVSQVNRMVRDVNRVVALQNRAAASSGQTVSS